MTNIKKRSFAIIMAFLVGIMFTVPSLTAEHANALSKTGKGKFEYSSKYTSSDIWVNNQGHRLTYYSIDGTTCICLNKALAFGNGSTYNRKSVSSVKYRGNQKNWLKPVLMFSYGSQTDPPYGSKADKFIASQMIVWQLGAKEIGSSTEKLGKHKKGKYYNVLKQHKAGTKNYDWIIDKVNQWKKGPSFKSKTYNMGEKTTYSITDSNSYQKYKVDSKKGLDSVKITKNSKGKYVYTVTKTKDGKGTLTLVDSKTKKTGAWYVYKCGSNQTVSAKPPADKKEYTVKFLKNEIPEQSLVIQKTDAETGEVVKKAGFKFQVKKKSDGTLWKDSENNTTFSTNANGKAYVSPFTSCSAGEWQIIETAVPKADEDDEEDIQYELNPTPVDIPAIAANQDVEMEVKFANSPAPDISTDAYDKDTTTHLGTIGEKCTIIDKVTCTSLVKGKQYTINGVLVDKESGEDIEGTNASVTFTMPRESGKITDKDGNEIGEATFEDGEASEAVIYMTYTFDSSMYAGKETVVAETLIPDGGNLVIHRDLEDTEQTIHFASIGTKAFDFVTNSDMGTVSKKQTIKDIVSFKNLIAGKEYAATGKIINKETGKALAEKKVFFNVNDDGTADVDEEEASEVNFSIKYNANGAYDENGKPIEEKKGIGEDKTQNINAEEEKQKEEAGEDTSSLYSFEDVNFEAPEGYVFDSWNTEPDGSGKSYSPERSASSLNAEEGDTITLYAQYIEGGENEDEEEGTPDEEDGNDPDAESQDQEDIPEPDLTTQKFVDGEFEMTFDDFDSSELQGKKIVVFEVVEYNDSTVAKHEEIDSEDQTITYPSLHTTALNKATNEHVPALGKKQTIIDTVSYTGLIPNKEYVLKGKLMDKNSKKPFMIDGKEVTKEMKFTPEKSNGEVKLEFEIDTSAIPGKTIVVYEDVYFENNPLVAHADIEDKDQSIYVPKIKTTANLSKDYKEIKDEVSYKNLVPGKKYVMIGWLVKKNGNKVSGTTVKKSFKPKKPDGKVTVTIPTKGKKGTFVVFEECRLKGKIVGEHKDLKDSNQTVFIPDKPNPQSGDDTIWWIFGIIGALAIIAGITIYRKRKI